MVGALANQGSTCSSKSKGERQNARSYRRIAEREDRGHGGRSAFILVSN